MSPEILNAILNWGPVAAILFGILYRADQIARALVPVVVEHFKKLADTMDAVTEGLKTLTSLKVRVEELGEDGQEDRAGIAEDAKHARIQATEANAGVARIEVLIRTIPQAEVLPPVHREVN